MSMSRSESHNKNRKRRRDRQRRLLLTGGTLLALLAVVIAVFALVQGQDRNPSSPPAGNEQQQSADADRENTEMTNSDEDANTGEGADTGTNGPAGNSAAEGGEQADPNNSAGQPDNAGEPEPTEPVEQGPVKLSFVGDILLAGSVDELMQSKGYDYPYAKALSFLQGADLTVGNLENPITDAHNPAEDKQFVFKGSSASLPSLKAAGFDLVSLANNHTLDHGVEGLLDTMSNLDEAGVRHMGGGQNDDEAFRPVILEKKGIKIAYLGFSRVLPVGEWKAAPDRAGVAESYDETRAVQAIKEARSQADLVVVYVHWGKEKADWPVEHQKVLGHAYIDAGADLVVGAHPHVLQGFESYKGKWIAYSLGNFIFNMTATLKTRDTGVLDATCTKEGDCSLQLHPMRAVQSQPAPLEGAEAAELLKRISGLSIGAAIDAEGNVTAKTPAASKETANAG